MARQQASPTDDDAVPMRPEDLHAVLPVTHTSTACAGAAAGFVLRKIAYRAGAYAPGIQDFVFHELTAPYVGRSLDGVNSWLRQRGGELHQMGYRLAGRRVMGERTDAILGWVKEGRGFRGAVLATEYRRLHPTSADADLDHAVGVTLDKLDPSGRDDLVLVDPWPGTSNGARDRGAIPAQLDAAHRSQKYSALIVYWSGYS